MNKIAFHALGVFSLSAALSSCGGLIPMPPVALGDMQFTAPNTAAAAQAEIDRLKAQHAAQLQLVPAPLVAQFEQELKANIQTAQKSFLKANVLFNTANAFNGPGDSKVNFLSSMKLNGQLTLAQPVAERTVLNVYLRPNTAACQPSAPVAVQLPQLPVSLPIANPYTYNADFAAHGLKVCSSSGGGIVHLGSIVVEAGKNTANVSLNALDMRDMYKKGSGHFGFNVTEGALPAGEIKLSGLVLNSRI